MAVSETATQKAIDVARRPPPPADGWTTSQSVVCPLCPSGGSFGESSTLGERGDVARPVQHADDDHRIRKRPIVDCVGAMKRYAQSGSQPIAPRCREREAPHRVERGFDLPDEPSRDLLG
jgi:hypothetical protein